ncbi:MAG: DUF4357 domain-containing protein [Prevotella sp.]|nr:DUF4357 domain-containing protein [Prevotella sp.]
MLSMMKSRIEGIRDALSKLGIADENTVINYCVLPILHDLGWDIFSPDEVRRVSNVIYDDSLCLGDVERPILCIIARSSDSPMQFNAFFKPKDAGARLTLYTNGHKWVLFSPNSLPNEAGGATPIYEWDFSSMSDADYEALVSFAKDNMTEEALLSRVFGGDISNAVDTVIQSMLSNPSDAQLEFLASEVSLVLGTDIPKNVMSNLLKSYKGTALDSAMPHKKRTRDWVDKVMSSEELHNGILCGLHSDSGESLATGIFFNSGKFVLHAGAKIAKLFMCNGVEVEGPKCRGAVIEACNSKSDDTGSNWVLQKDISVTSASTAAAIVCGGWKNGFTAWKISADGLSLHARLLGFYKDMYGEFPEGWD